MILVTGCNKNYLPRMMPYLESLQQYADFPVYLVGVGFQPPDVEGINTITVSKEQNAGAPPETESIQHGAFVQVLDVPDDEIIVYTDGDFVMQRAMDDSERALLSLNHFQAVTSWNGGPHETLKTEAGRIGQKVSDEQMARIWGAVWQDRPIYNVGFLALTRSGWDRLWFEYCELWATAGDCFSHQARQQWLISYVIDLYFETKIAPWSLHAHGHFGLKPGMDKRPDAVYADGKKALFRHYI